MGLAFQASGPVFMLSGQGSQAVGMGSDLMDVSEVKEAFSCASDAFGFDVAQMALHAAPEELCRTVCAQATISALSVGIARALIARGVEPAAVLGFSLGQIGALAVSGMLSLDETFELAAYRARLMEQAAFEHPGSMCALLKADEDAAAEVCALCAEGEVLVAANFNCPGQIVVSGSKAAIARVREAWASHGGRSKVLATAGAFHSPLMQEASDAFGEYLSTVAFAEARIPLICNLDSEPLSACDAADHLARHLVEPVRFDQSVVRLAAAGAVDFVETGFGGVLVGLVKRIDKDLGRTLVQDRAGFDAACARWCMEAGAALAGGADGSETAFDQGVDR